MVTARISLGRRDAVTCTSTSVAESTGGEGGGGGGGHDYQALVHAPQLRMDMEAEVGVRWWQRLIALGFGVDMLR